jgi:hypothetical protein
VTDAGALPFDVATQQTLDCKRVSNALKKRRE